MGGLLRSCPGVLLLCATAACSQVIGISAYEIDPSLDESTKSAGGAGQPDAGASAIDGGEGGTDSGGKGNAGSQPVTGGHSAGGAAGQTDRGGGGAEPAGCESASECDDGIDCTTDVCLPDGTCQATAVDSECDASKCQTCQLGVGCVAGATATVELLTDPGFDGTNEDWVETSDTFNDQNIFASDTAQTAPNVAQFGPGASGAEKQEYADLLQYVIIPERTVGIQLTGYYKLTPGTALAEEDYAVAAFYELGATDPIAQFHEWPGDSGAQAAWKSFTYNAPKADVADMVAGEYSFDLVAYSWDSVFFFDSLKLTATVCE